MDFKQQIQKFQPYNEQEERDKQTMLKWTKQFEDVLTRQNELAHFTASSWVVNRERTKVLMAYHNIYQSWAWTGGHSDGETDLLQTAIREVKEETGIEHVKPICEDIFSLEILCVNGHIKKENYVSSHLHFNVTYLLEADETEMLHTKPDENSGVKWILLEDVTKMSNEKWMCENVYLKLMDKLRNMAL